MINMLFRRIRPAFASWRLLLGRDPRRAPPFSIVLFPLRPSVLFCGIGGILAVKKGPKPVSANARAAGPRGPTGPARAGMAHDGAAGAARCLINKCYRRWGSGR